MDKKKQKLIDVTISCYQTVKYSQCVKMTVEDYEALEKVSQDDVTERDNPTEYHLINDYLDPRDVMDAANEFTQFEIEKD